MTICDQEIGQKWLKPSLSLFHTRHFYLLQKEKHANYINGPIPLSALVSWHTQYQGPVIAVSNTDVFPKMTCQNVWPGKGLMDVNLYEPNNIIYNQIQLAGTRLADRMWVHSVAYLCMCECVCMQVICEWELQLTGLLPDRLLSPRGSQKPEALPSRRATQAECIRSPPGSLTASNPFQQRAAARPRA